MKLFDSNLVIYAAKPYYASLRPLLLNGDSCVSIITKLEALGFHNLTMDDKIYLEGVFNAMPVIAIDNAVIERAILFRQAKKMSVGDAIIAATALLNGCDLYTNNVKDFTHITGLTAINPLNNQ